MPDDAGPLSDFGDLLRAASSQHEPQRLMFVFARKQLADHATPTQRLRFECNEGAWLEPCLCVDKSPEEIVSFAALAAESERTGVEWDLVFVSSLSGRGGVAPNSDEAHQPLRFMVTAINEGRVEDMAVFDRAGRPIRFV